MDNNIVKLETHQERLQEAQKVVDMFSKITNKAYGNDSYAAGYLGTVLATTLSTLSEEQFNKIVKQITSKALSFK